MPVKRKALRLKHALKSATRRNSTNGALLPLPNEQPLTTLRLEIVSCSDLLAKDRNGYSDPFVVASILKQKHQTPVVKKSVDPVFNSVFDFPLYLSLADQLAMIELIVWDKDMLRNDYLGEVSLPLESWFTGNPTYRFDQAPPVTLNLESTREGTKAQGKISIRLGFIDEGKDLKRAFEQLVRESRPSIVSAPPTEGVGTTHDDGRVDDDGGISSDEDEQQLTTDESDSEDEAEGDQDTPLATSARPMGAGTPLYTIYSPPDHTQHPHTPIPVMLSPQTPRSRLPLTPRFKRSLSGSSPVVSPLTPTPASAEPTSVNKKKGFRKSWSSSPSAPTLPVTPTTPGRPKRSASLSRITRRRRTREPYSLPQNTSITGILLLTISHASSLPRLPSFHRLTFDMDPFVVISFSTKIFRTRVIRHSLNPVWEEKLGIHVRKWETGRGLNVRFKVVDWDKFSGNDFVGEGYLDLDSLIATAPAPDPQTGLFDLVKLGEEGGLEGEGKEYVIPLSLPGKELVEGGATLTVRAKYTPYSLLRQQFWSRLLHSYDLDDTLALSHIELSSMLDSLGSTLSRSTIESFWSRFGKDHKTDELTFGEVISCLEDEIGKESSEKPPLNPDNGENAMEIPSGAMTPLFSVKDAKGRNISLEDVRFDFGPSVTEGLDEYFSREHKEASSAGSSPGATSSGAEDVSEPEEVLTVSSPQIPPISVDSVDATPKSKARRSKFRRKPKPTLPLSPLPGAELVQERERIINIATCPLCNRPRMNSKAEVDIITHLAVCSSDSDTTTSSGKGSGSAGLTRLIAGEFVTASQAQRKWLSKFLSKMSTGSYALGANSANIIVQDRRTGQLEEERMQVYVRLGIRLLYKGATSRMESSRARSMLKSLSIKQGLKFDHPDSIRDIPAFITFYNLNMNEVLKPLQDFTSFNDFFYRKLKPDARPVEGSGDDRMVSAADCRFMAFESISSATNIWIKGRSFSAQKLLGPASWADLKEARIQAFEGGPLCIFRLAPQDYHRFHSPVRGTIGKIRSIEGEYYTVNPQAIRTTIDVYGENVRTIVPIHSLEFGTVIAVCIGAMMVGSVVITVKEGQEVQRGEEFGYFAFGGSTIVMLFEKGRVVWDEDLQVNGRASLETLVRVGMGIGKTSRNGQA